MGTVRPAKSAGLTLPELLIVVAILGILAAIGLPLYHEVTARSRIAKAQADVRMLATAVGAYQAHVGALPPDLDALTVTTANAAGLTAGPFIAGPPPPPSTAWTSYGYVPGANGAFTVSAAGEGTTVSGP